jgi:predicted RNase H-like HicB family nuclease
MATAVYIEEGAKRTFACAPDWPGWCRSGKGEEEALAALAMAAPRYAVAAEAAGFPLPAGAGEKFQVVERLPGTATTDFGAPDREASGDGEPLSDDDAERLAALLKGSWTVFDRVVATAPAELRKGPRGGGRDRDKIVAHVLGAEVGYASRLGLRLGEPPWDDRAAMAAFREAIVGALRTPPAEGPRGGKRWPGRYAARRIAWHALDHAWEIEDRSGEI